MIKIVQVLDAAETVLGETTFDKPGYAFNELPMGFTIPVARAGQPTHVRLIAGSETKKSTITPPIGSVLVGEHVLLKGPKAQ